jgi:hypothetical protein
VLRANRATLGDLGPLGLKVRPRLCSKVAKQSVDASLLRKALLRKAYRLPIKPEGATQALQALEQHLDFALKSQSKLTELRRAV